MANEPKKDDKPKNWGRRFRVTKGTVGAFNKGDVFAEGMFQLLNAIPMPVDPGTRLPIDPPEGHPLHDPKAYFNALLDRLLALEVIESVPESTPCSQPPIGPGGMYGAATNSIAESAQSVIRSRRIAAESVGVRPPDGPVPEDRVIKQGMAVAV